MSAEEWRPIPGAWGYDVSSQGRVRSWRRPGMGNPVLRTEPLVLAQRLNRTGYQTVSLRRDGSNYPAPVHTLVAAAFHGYRPEGMEIRHLDGDNLNNTATNLRYGTRSENIADQVRHGTHANASKTHCKHGHPFAGENLRIDTKGRRVCRTCNAAACDRYRLKRTGVAA